MSDEIAIRRREKVPAGTWFQNEVTSLQLKLPFFIASLKNAKLIVNVIGLVSLVNDYTIKNISALRAVQYVVIFCIIISSPS